ncbi:MAG: CPBP family intramembrane metalloprotease [Candidatus Heimdallarchaeota archaeon]|nr:MAG: CPBP family intramembrane metalloprotease [Candidatus Heimdallarchaeota archaeon]
MTLDRKKTNKDSKFKVFVVKNRLPLFFILTLLYTWAFWLPLALISYGGTNIQILLFIGQSLGTIGPLVALFILGKASGGEVSLTKILDKIQITINKKEISWLIIASLAIPSFTILGNIVNYFFGFKSNLHILQPDKWELLGFWLILIIPVTFFPFLLTSPLFEEPGWRGFAIEELQMKFGRHIGSLIIGSFWWLWHQPINIAWGIELTLYSYFLMLVHSFTIDSLYNLSERNLLSAMLAHGSTFITYTYVYSGTNDLFIILVFIVLIIILRTIESKKEKQIKEEFEYSL